MDKGNLNVNGRLVGLYTIIVMAASICAFGYFVQKCEGVGYQSDTIRIEKHDTIEVEVHDTLPVEKGREVIRYVTLPYPCGVDTICSELEPDSGMKLPVVQKMYSDDSTYTAYVSGVEFEDLPKLDSVIVKRREITNNIFESVIVKKPPRKLSVGLQVGYGYGFHSKQVEPYAGFGISWRIW